MILIHQFGILSTQQTSHRKNRCLNMKVKELIKRLENFNPEAEIVMEACYETRGYEEPFLHIEDNKICIGYP